MGLLPEIKMDWIGCSLLRSATMHLCIIIAAAIVVLFFAALYCIIV